MAKNNPEPKKEVSTRLDRVLGSLKKDYFLIGKKNVRSWHAYLAMGVLVGLVIGVGYTINTGQFQKFFGATNASASVVFSSWYRFEPVAFKLTNNTTQSLPLGTTNPWKIVDSSGNLIYQPPTQTTAASLSKRGSKQWVWAQKDNAGNFVNPGDYRVVFDGFGTSASFSILADYGSLGLVSYSFANINSPDILTILIKDPQILRSAIDNYYGKNTKHAPLGVLADDRPNKSAVDPQWSWHLSKLDLASKCNTTDANNLIPSKIEGNLNYYFSNNGTKSVCFGSAQISSLNSPNSQLTSPTKQIWSSDVSVSTMVQQMEQAAPNFDQIIKIAQQYALTVNETGSRTSGEYSATITVPNTSRVLVYMRKDLSEISVSGNSTGKTATCKVPGTNLRIKVDENNKVNFIDSNFYLGCAAGTDPSLCSILMSSCNSAIDLFNQTAGIDYSPSGDSSLDNRIFLGNDTDPDANGSTREFSFLNEVTQSYRTIAFIDVSTNELTGASPTNQASVATCEHEYFHALGFSHTSNGSLFDYDGGTNSNNPQNAPANTASVVGQLASCARSPSQVCMTVEDCVACPENAHYDSNSSNADKCTCNENYQRSSTNSCVAVSTDISGGGGGGGGVPSTCAPSPSTSCSPISSEGGGIYSYSCVTSDGCGGLVSETCDYDAESSCYQCLDTNQCIGGILP